MSGLSLVDVVRQAVQYRQHFKQVGTLVAPYYMMSGLSLADVVRQYVRYRQHSKQVGTLVDTILYDVWTFSC